MNRKESIENITWTFERKYGYIVRQTKNIVCFFRQNRKEEKNEKHITGNDAAYYKYGRKRRFECMQNTSKWNFRTAGLCVSVERLSFYRMKQYKNCINANKMMEAIEEQCKERDKDCK